jgi:hypothetical protein
MFIPLIRSVISLFPVEVVEAAGWWMVVMGGC